MKKDISKRKTPFFLTLKSLSIKLQLFFTSYCKHLKSQKFQISGYFFQHDYLPIFQITNYSKRDSENHCFIFLSKTLLSGGILIS